ncbi:hypothetical protein GPJ61_27700 [Brevibacillus formosus]|uniref:hypothetical protein n=1 Tax=Brevibacillus formosus TaxID=54913 RepID=UPI001CA5A2B8|nr:hypothetical protein [Brevibacillus formosus]MBW5471575.1 hypothetical protein [Brevibacillus formosus]
MDKVNSLLIFLFVGILVLALTGAVVYLGFGQSIQQQTNDQANQVSGFQNDPMNGTVNIKSINGSESPSKADTWD